jgi:hypothetical protein
MRTVRDVTTIFGGSLAERTPRCRSTQRRSLILSLPSSLPLLRTAAVPRTVILPAGPVASAADVPVTPAPDPQCAGDATFLCFLLNVSGQLALGLLIRRMT